MINNRSLVEVGVSMVLRDRFSQEAGRISNSFRTMMNDMNNWNRGLQMSSANAIEFGQELIGGMARAYQYSAGVYDQVFLASKMSRASNAQQKGLMQVAKDVNEITPLTARDIASGEKYLAMAGNSVNQIKNMIGPAAELASIFSMPLGEKGGVADLMTNIMQTFNLPSEKARTVVDQLATAVTSANISLTDLAQSFQYSGAEFRNAKISMGDAAAAIGVLGNQGIQASSAGTALANMMRYLTLSVTGQKRGGGEMLKKLGIDPDSLVDAQGNLLRLDKIIAILGDKLRGARGIDISSALFNIFGVRGTRAASALLQDYWSGTNKLEELMNRVNNESMGVSSDLTQQRLQTPAGIIDQFKSHLENLVVNIGDALGEMFGPLLKLASGFLNIVNDIAETWGGKLLVKVIATSVIFRVIRQSYQFFRMMGRMIATAQELTANDSHRMADGFTRANTQAAQLELHLQRISHLMMRISASQLAKGTWIPMVGGGMIGKNKKGRVQARDDKGKFIPMTVLAAGGGQTVAKTAGKKVAEAAGQTVAKKGAMMAGGKLLGTFGSRLLGFLGGPWGLGISIALPILIDVIGGLTGSVNKNTEALTKEEEIRNMRERNEKAFLEAMRSAIKDGLKEGKINISVDGQILGDYTLGSQADYTGVALGL